MTNKLVPEQELCAEGLPVPDTQKGQPPKLPLLIMIVYICFFPQTRTPWNLRTLWGLAPAGTPEAVAVLCCPIPGSTIQARCYGT